MKVYIDLLIIVNFIFDFILLSATNYILKRSVKFYRLIAGSIIGTLSVLFLFLPLSSFTLFMLKIVTSIFMVLTTFSYHSAEYFKKNFIYLYISSIILGGIMYLLDIMLNYNNSGLVFTNNNLSLNFIVLLVLGPIIFYYYLKEHKNYKLNIQLHQQVTITINKKDYTYDAYIDTGNKLKDPYKKRNIILIYDKKLKLKYENSILVPYNTLDNNGLIKCQKPDKVKIGNKEIRNVLIGQATEKFNLEGVNCILPNSIKEEFCD